MVAFAIRQSEETLFENWIVAIPQCHTKAEQLLFIADAGKTILAPVVSSGARLVMGEVVPGISIIAIVFTNRAPLALAQVRPPLPPVGLALAGFLQSRLFLCHRTLLLLYVDLAAARMFCFSSGVG